MRLHPHREAGGSRAEEEKGTKGYNSWQHSSRLPDQSRQESLSHKNHRNSLSPDEQKANSTATQSKNSEVHAGLVFRFLRSRESLVVEVWCIEDNISKPQVNFIHLGKTRAISNINHYKTCLYRRTLDNFIIQAKTKQLFLCVFWYYVMGNKVVKSLKAGICSR